MAIILDGFSEQSENEAIRIDSSSLDHFFKIWRKFDKDSTGYIEVKLFDDLLQELISS